MCWSQRSAVAVRYGSMQISLAPWRRACCARLQKCTLEVIGLEPQMRMSLDCAKRSTSMPTAPPSV